MNGYLCPAVGKHGDKRLTEEALREGKVLCNLHRVTDGVEALEAEEDIVHTYDLHANCYVTKYPVNLDSFIEVIRSIDSFWLALVTLPPKSEG